MQQVVVQHEFGAQATARTALDSPLPDPIFFGCLSDLFGMEKRAPNDAHDARLLAPIFVHDAHLPVPVKTPVMLMRCLAILCGLSMMLVRRVRPTKPKTSTTVTHALAHSLR